MATIPDLWSDDIKVDVVTPLAILLAQVGPMQRKTKGLLQAEVTTTTSNGGWVKHQLDLIAPVLDGYRHRLLAATHERDLVYPVQVDAECFEVSSAEARAHTEEEFIGIVSIALHSHQVRSIIQSLIARSNERRGNTAVSEPGKQE